MDIRPMRKETGVSLVEIWPSAWESFTWPYYQRKPNSYRVKKIAEGLRGGYRPDPITVYQTNGKLHVVDGGHRVLAYMFNKQQYELSEPIPALLYTNGAINENETFVRENTKLRMSPVNIIRANERSRCCELIRGLSSKGSLFAEYGDPYNYPVGALSIVKAGIILAKEGDDLQVYSQAYLSVASAIDELDSILLQDPGHWANGVERFLGYLLRLWGNDGRHLLNFGVLGFAYFLSKNRPRFFKNGKLVIQSTRSRNSGKRGTRITQDRSDFTKLAALEVRWNKRPDPLYIEASRDPGAVAQEINRHFWRSHPKKVRIWRPELTL